MIPRRLQDAGRALWGSAYLLLFFTALFWAGNAVVGRAAREFVPPTALSFWRWAFAFLLVLPLALPHLRRDWPSLLRRWRTVVVLGVLGIGAFNTLLYAGLQSTTALNSLLLQSAQPGLILLFGAVLFRDRTGPAQVGGALLALAGALIIVTKGRVEVLAGLQLNGGDLLIVLAVVLWALYSVLLRRRPQAHPLSFLAGTLAVGVCAITPLYLAEIASGRMIEPRAESWLAIGYVSIFPSVLAYLCFNRGVELIGSAATGQYLNIMPVLGAGLAVLFLGESLRPFHLAGALLIAAGILLAARRARDSATPTPPVGTTSRPGN